MDWDTSVAVPILIAALGLLGAQVLAVLSRRHDRQQSARVTLLDPAHRFAETALAALASLRHVTPPKAESPSLPRQRNSPLLADRDERNERLRSSRNAIDEVRTARAGVRLAFHPKSWAAEYSRQTLSALRACLEEVEEFYALHDEQLDDPDWLGTHVPELRARYKAHRSAAYQALDNFFEDVAARLSVPTWNPKRIEQADYENDLRWNGY